MPKEKMGGKRKASSSVKPKIDNKLTKMYQTNSNGNKHLIGYKYNGYTIDIEEEQRKYSMFGTKKWYHSTFKDGGRIATETLKEMKELLNKDIKNELPDYLKKRK